MIKDNSIILAKKVTSDHLVHGNIVEVDNTYYNVTCEGGQSSIDFENANIGDTVTLKIIGSCGGGIFTDFINLWIE